MCAVRIHPLTYPPLVFLFISYPFEYLNNTHTRKKTPLRTQKGVTMICIMNRVRSLCVPVCLCMCVFFPFVRLLGRLGKNTRAFTALERVLSHPIALTFSLLCIFVVCISDQTIPSPCYLSDKRRKMSSALNMPPW